MVVTSLILLGSNAMAADFPVGSFGCGSDKVKVTELKVGGKSLPYVESADPTNSSVEYKGIATIVLDKVNKTVTLSLVTDNANAETTSYSFTNGKYLSDSNCL